MKIILLLFVVTFVNFVACLTPPNPKCPLNEHFETQSNRCQITCANMALEPYMGPCYPSDSCYCNGKKVRNAKGICIDRSECPNADPNECPKNEHRDTCGKSCNATCDDPNPVCCDDVCKDGCFCNKGYVRNSFGDCVTFDKCPTKKCPGKNEEYQVCGRSCPDTCENYKNTCKVCTKPCTSGCFCKNGFIRGPKGDCINPKNCPELCTKPHEHHDWCPRNCPGDGCDRLWTTVNCTYASTCCTGACRCDPGYYRNNLGQCVTAEECKCGKHAHYDKCPPIHCPPGKICPAVCIPACVCDAGYKFNDKHVCVKDQHPCGKNEHYDPCANRCPKGVKCKIVCKGACVCNEGYKRDKYGHCILDIPIKQCPGKNEEYQVCGRSCPDTCENYKNTCKVCTKPCTSGCFCKNGFIRGPKGDCINPKNCPELCTKPHEHHDWCPRNCPGDGCDRLWTTVNCTYASTCCTGACRCDPGYYRNNLGKCVTAEECKCGKHAHYDKCPPIHCPPGKICPAVCIPACVCDAGYKFNDKHVCVKDQHPCGKNEHYDPCANRCPKGVKCKIVCKGACVCNEGYKRDKYGHCILDIPIKQCPGKNEEYQVCGRSCPDTCENYKNTCKVCTKPCTSGCFCKNGFIRGPKGDCINPKNCPELCTKPHEHHEWCPRNCPGDGCDRLWTTVNCTYASTCCTGACRCDPGFYRNNDGICVTAKQCKTKGQCANHSHYDSCINCPKDNICFIPCEGGCACDKGYKAGTDKVCVKIHPDNCGPNSYFCDCDDCYADESCEPGCVCYDGYEWDRFGRECIPYKCGLHSYYDDCSDCDENELCEPGCVCYDGYKYDKLKNECVLIPPVECCENEHYENCGTACPATCDNPSPKVCTKQCVSGCFCNSGLLRNKDGKCVPKDQCQCGKHAHVDYCPPEHCKPGKHCPKVKCCLCDKGYELNKNGTCDKVHLPKCGKNEVPTDCYSICENDYCKKPGDPTVLCKTAPCPPYRPGCECKKGYKLNNKIDRKCIPAEDCPCNEKPHGGGGGTYAYASASATVDVD